jgi:hypothetical protein
MHEYTVAYLTGLAVRAFGDRAKVEHRLNRPTGASVEARTTIRPAPCMRPFMTQNSRWLTGRSTAPD